MKQVEEVIQIGAGERYEFDVDCYRIESSDGVSDIIAGICDKYEIAIAALGSIESDLGLLTLEAEEDDLKELAGEIQKRVKASKMRLEQELNNEYNEKPDWEDYAPLEILQLAILNNCEGSLTENLRSHYQDAVGGDFTEEGFRLHLERIRNQFGLSEDFGK